MPLAGRNSGRGNSRSPDREGGPLGNGDIPAGVDEEGCGRARAALERRPHYTHSSNLVPGPHSLPMAVGLRTPRMSRERSRCTCGRSRAQAEERRFQRVAGVSPFGRARRASCSSVLWTDGSWWFHIRLRVTRLCPDGQRFAIVLNPDGTAEQKGHHELDRSVELFR